MWMDHSLNENGNKNKLSLLLPNSLNIYFLTITANLIVLDLNYVVFILLYSFVSSPKP